LAPFGFSDNYRGYDIVTKRNEGDPTGRGAELSNQQSFGALSPWAKGCHVFGNGTLLDVSDPNATDQSGLSPRTMPWGTSYAQQKFSARVNGNQNKWRRNSASAASATIRPASSKYFASQVKFDAPVFDMFSRRYALYFDRRNLAGTLQRRGTWAPDTPVYARIDILQQPTAAFTLGLKGDFRCNQFAERSPLLPRSARTRVAGPISPPKRTQSRAFPAGRQPTLTKIPTLRTKLLEPITPNFP
jgi:hypothetical protein